MDRTQGTLMDRGRRLFQIKKVEDTPVRPEGEERICVYGRAYVCVCVRARARSKDTKDRDSTEYVKGMNRTEIGGGDERRF